jgi:hypothetical protein
MIMRTKTLRPLVHAALIGLIGAASQTGADAIERRPLPDVGLSAPDGADVQAGSLALDGTWLLVFVSADCRPCDSLLRQVEERDMPGVAARLTVVVRGAPAERVLAYQAKFPELAVARWLVDRDRAFEEALQIRGMPTIVGLRGGTIEWSLGGVLREGADLQSVLASWIRQP